MTNAEAIEILSATRSRVTLALLRGVKSRAETEQLVRDLEVLATAYRAAMARDNFADLLVEAAEDVRRGGGR
jgi:hypothetical protein